MYINIDKISIISTLWIVIYVVVCTRQKFKKIAFISFKQCAKNFSVKNKV